MGPGCGEGTGAQEDPRGLQGQSRGKIAGLAAADVSQGLGMGQRTANTPMLLVRKPRSSEQPQSRDGH